MYKKNRKKCNQIQNDISKKEKPFIWKIHFHMLEEFNYKRYVLCYKIEYFF